MGVNLSWSPVSFEMRHEKTKISGKMTNKFCFIIQPTGVEPIL